MTSTEILNQYLENNTLMQLATQSNGELWICNVYFASDDKYNIFWTSARHRRHSRDIESNPKVAATIVHNLDKKQAVQISGIAYRVSLEESKNAHDIYGTKLGQKDSRLDEVMLDAPDSRAYWVLKPETIELWDELNFPESPKIRVEISNKSS